MAHHYETTLRPSLAGLEPVQRASAIGGYVAETGIAPEPAIKTLLGLAVTGEAVCNPAAQSGLPGKASI